MQLQAQICAYLLQRNLGRPTWWKQNIVYNPEINRKACTQQLEKSAYWCFPAPEKRRQKRLTAWRVGGALRRGSFYCGPRWKNGRKIKELGVEKKRGQEGRVIRGDWCTSDGDKSWRPRKKHKQSSTLFAGRLALHKVKCLIIRGILDSLEIHGFSQGISSSRLWY